MPVPILRQGRTLVASVRAALTDSEWNAFRDALMQRISQARATGVIVDVSAMDVMDSYASRSLQSLAMMTQLRGAITVVGGIQPDVAYAMARLGLALPHVRCALDLDDAFEVLHRHANSRGAHG